MRPILIDDLLAAAEAALALAPEARAETLVRWLDEAHAADLYRKRLGRVHPRWGLGSLGARARCEPRCRPLRPDGARLAALGLVLASVTLWRRRVFSRTPASPI
ncbi:DUF7742 family protein [Rhodobacter maris]|uniref:DUF7742 domain-containing protein n=1 Tax=Rhodobacter maris TaxID=446682 RepID=A0A285SIP6_9RHOB|nr:hypothetical protein [Rhodobacter maris]SOC07716.1 hypothetical protein SAMN05877831_10644 [Rhodobacter maris]